MSPERLAAWATALTIIPTIAGVVVAFVFARRANRAADLARVAADLAVATRWMHTLREWSFRCIDVLSEAAETCASPATRAGDDSELASCRHRLSSLIDQGRFFLPNQRTNSGADKPTAFQGRRREQLDYLVAAYNVLSGARTIFGSREAAIRELQRYFVSDIQRILAPEYENARVARLMASAEGDRAWDVRLGGLLADPDVTK